MQTNSRGHQMRRMTVGRRLQLASFGSIALLLLALVTAWWAYGRIQSSQHTISNQRIPEIVWAKDFAEKTALLIAQADALQDITTQKTYQLRKAQITAQLTALEQFLDQHPTIKQHTVIDAFSTITTGVKEQLATVANVLSLQQQVVIALTATNKAIDDVLRLLKPALLEAAAAVKGDAKTLYQYQGISEFRHDILLMRRDFSALARSSILTDLTRYEQRVLLALRRVSQVLPTLDTTDNKVNLATAVEHIRKHSVEADALVAKQRQLLTLKTSSTDASKRNAAATIQLNTLVNNTVDAAREGLATATSTANRAAVVSIFVLSTLLVLGVVSTVVWLKLHIEPKISHRLYSLAEATKGLANGNLTTPITPTGNDEITEMAVAVETFRMGLLERESAQQAVQQLSHELQLIFDNVPAAIWYKDEHNKILRLNATAAATMGGTVQAFTGKDTYDLFPEMAKKYHDDDLAVINSGKQLLGIVEEYTPLDAPRKWVSTDKVPYVDPDTGTRGVLVVSQDITPLKEAQKTLENMVETLTESNEELERFAYVASHDLQEPLRMVTNFCQLLSKRYADKLDDTGQQYIDIANTAAKRMQALVSDLLEYARVGSTSNIKESVDTQKCVTFVLENVAHSIMEHNAVVSYEGLPVIQTNKMRFCLLLQNLISNAIKYCAADVTPNITIAASKKIIEEQHFWQFTVTDNGIGMKQEYAEKIFLPFQRLHSKDEYSGTGIGLAMCRKIVESFNGEIWVTSNLGDGTTVYFTILSAS